MEAYTNFGFVRRAHRATKANNARSWEGEVVLVTASAVVSEVDVERDLEALIQVQALPLFGVWPRLAYINFVWSKAELEAYGADVQCAVKIGYKSDVAPWETGEAAMRLARYGLEAPHAEGG